MWCISVIYYTGAYVILLKDTQIAYNFYSTKQRKPYMLKGKHIKNGNFKDISNKPEW